MELDSDDEKALTKTIEASFPLSERVLCTKHLKDNLKHYMSDVAAVKPDDRVIKSEMNFATEVRWSTAVRIQKFPEIQFRVVNQLKSTNSTISDAEDAYSCDFEDIREVSNDSGFLNLSTLPVCHVQVTPLKKCYSSLSKDYMLDNQQNLNHSKQDTSLPRSEKFLDEFMEPLSDCNVNNLCHKSCMINFLSNDHNRFLGNENLRYPYRFSTSPKATSLRNLVLYLNELKTIYSSFQQVDNNQEIINNENMNDSNGEP
ncbi:unnamed protein product [Mytilus edulis]|uniref:Uncharacterized protein n=1 Tax=Mytilus edulis TaxID=6550 RepID=A0A8S3V889_MYTED|nr:unnamed protein product [Mytilus edulis]